MYFSTSFLLDTGTINADCESHYQNHYKNGGHRCYDCYQPAWQHTCNNSIMTFTSETFGPN